MGSVNIILLERKVGWPSSRGYRGSHTLIPAAPHASHRDSNRCNLSLPDDASWAWSVGGVHIASTDPARQTGWLKDQLSCTFSYACVIVQVEKAPWNSLPRSNFAPSRNTDSIHVIYTFHERKCPIHFLPVAWRFPLVYSNNSNAKQKDSKWNTYSNRYSTCTYTCA